MDKYIDKAFLTICYLYFAIVFSLSLTDDYRIFAVLFVLFLSTTIFGLKKFDKCNRRIYNYNHIKRKLFEEYNTQKNDYKYVLYIFIIILIGQIVYWLSYFPGGFNLDAYGQWMQAHNDMNMNDWHPFVSTLIIKLIVNIWDNFAFYIFCGILMYALSSTLIVYEFSQHGVKRIWLHILTAIYSISPAICLQNICLTKDVQFTIVFNFLFLLFLKVFFSKGKWLKKRRNIVYLSVVCTLLLLIRHNGILLIGTLLLMLLVFYGREKKNVFMCIFLVVCMFLIIKIPISKLIHIEPHDNVVGELVGIPMGIMTNALVNDNENIPEEVHSFLNSIASDSEWKTHYIIGEWDSCKWKFDTSETLKNITVYDIIRYTVITAISCPETTYQSFKANTRITWEFCESLKDWIPFVYIEENTYGIIPSNFNVFHKVTDILLNVSMLFPINLVLWNVGFQHIIIFLIYVAFKNNVNRYSLVFIVPLLVFNLGTTLLLAGPNYRYFYHTGIIFIPILFLLFYTDKAEVI